MSHGKIDKSVLFFFSNIHDSFNFFVIPNSSVFYDLAMKANGLQVNINDEEYDSSVVDFVVKLSEEIYQYKQGDQVTTYQDHSILNYLVPSKPVCSYVFDEVSYCSFPD